MVEVAQVYSQFLYVESCAQCPACERGSGEITGLLQMVQDGEASTTDVGQIGGWLERVTDGNRCYLPVEERELVSSLCERSRTSSPSTSRRGVVRFPAKSSFRSSSTSSTVVTVYDANQARSYRTGPTRQPSNTVPRRYSAELTSTSRRQRRVASVAACRRCRGDRRYDR